MGSKLIHGDCLSALRELENESVDLVLTDPPYGIDFQSCFRSDGCGGYSSDRSKLRPKISNDKTPFIWWLHDAFRVTNQGGSLLCFCRWDVQETFRLAIEAAGYTVKSQVIWDKGGGGLGDLKASFAPQHEIIWFATKGKYAFPGKRPMSVIRCPKVPSCHIVHPNEKPIPLMTELLSVCPNPGTVLDPFLGSGAVGVATVESGREFIGIEMDRGYLDLASKRITFRTGADEDGSEPPISIPITEPPCPFECPD